MEQKSKCSPAHAQDTGRVLTDAPRVCVMHSPISTFPRHGGVGGDVGGVGGGCGGVGVEGGELPSP